MTGSKAIILVIMAATLWGCGSETPKQVERQMSRTLVPAGSIVTVERRSDASGTHVLLVPEAAVFQRGALAGVYVVDTEGRLTIRWVRTGRHENGYLVILGGLDAGEKVVGNRFGRIGEGMLVEEQVSETKEVQSNE